MECGDFRSSAHCPVRADQTISIHGAHRRSTRFILLLFIGDQRLSFKKWWLLSRSLRQHNRGKIYTFQNDMRRNGRYYNYYKIQSINGHLHGRTMIFSVRYQIFTQQHTLWNNIFIFWWMLIVCIYDAERHMPARIVAHFHLISALAPLIELLEHTPHKPCQKIINHST